MTDDLVRPLQCAEGRQLNVLRTKFLKVAAALAAVIAFSAAAAAQDWQARHAMSQAQFQSVFNDLEGKGYRLKCMSGYMGGAEQYAALWVKASGPAWQARSSMTEAEFQKN